MPCGLHFAALWWPFGEAVTKKHDLVSWDTFLQTHLTDLPEMQELVSLGSPSPLPTQSSPGGIGSQSKSSGYSEIPATSPRALEDTRLGTTSVHPS